MPNNDIEKLNKSKGGAKIPRRAVAIVAGAAIMITTIVSPLFMGCSTAKGGLSMGTNPKGIKTVQAAYPAPTGAKLSAQEFIEGDAIWEWWDEYSKKLEATEGLNKEALDYYNALLKNVLIKGDENTVVSPLNTYIAFAMLAEVTDGNSRQQILDMLGAKDLESLRKNVNLLWQSNYVDTPILKSVLANSLWLNDDFNFKEETLKNLADNYFASSFRGDPASEAFNQALRDWTNANTGDLLTEYTKEMQMDPLTVIEMVSTIYYKAEWTKHFSEGLNTEETFHGAKGDTTVTMMHNSEVSRVCVTDKFTALKLDLERSGSMYFILPAEGYDINAVASDPETLKVLTDIEDEHWKSFMTNMSIPKFSVSSKTDLLETLRALGVTDVLSAETADFTPITSDSDELALTKADHAAIVEVDETGVTGAAYTEMAVCLTSIFMSDTLDFVLDEPFMFVTTGADGSVLFSGLVKNIE